MPKHAHKPPKTAKFSKPPKRFTNQSQRTREYLTQQEVTQLFHAAKRCGRQGQRDETLILMMFRHAFRVSEVIALRWEQVDLKQALLHVNRIKGGLKSTHPLGGVELRALRHLKRQQPLSPYVFLSERQTPLTARTVHHIVRRAGITAKLALSVHPHM